MQTVVSHESITKGVCLLKTAWNLDIHLAYKWPAWCNLSVHWNYSSSKTWFTCKQLPNLPNRLVLTQKFGGWVKGNTSAYHKTMSSKKLTEFLNNQQSGEIWLAQRYLSFWLNSGVLSVHSWSTKYAKNTTSTQRPDFAIQTVRIQFP